VTIALGSQVLHYDRAHDGIGHGGLLACIYIVKKTENVVGWCAAQNLPCVLCALVFPGVCVCSTAYDRRSFPDNWYQSRVKHPGHGWLQDR
jgi:hypothetical protein